MNALRRCAAALLAACCLLPTAPALAGQPEGRLAPDWSAPPHEVVPGEMLVKFRSHVPARAREMKHYREGARRLREFRHAGVEHLALAPGQAVDAALRRYRADPDVEYAEPNWVLHAQAVPADPLYGQLWGLNNAGQTGGAAGADIRAQAAWDLVTGSPNVVVVVIDTGIDYNHPDLAPNAWVNAAELNGLPGVDDDGNGYVDDIHGIDTHNGDADPMDDHGHGTHVSGTIGATGNNGVGVAGVNWNVRIAGCKFLDNSGRGNLANAITCLEYVRNLKNAGVPVVATSNSWGGGGFSQAMRDAIDAQRDILFIAAAGNASFDNDAGDFYPADYRLPNVISVAATDHNDAKAGFSNWGRRSVHLGAPGVSILSTLPNNSYGNFSGTSMATPHVSGVAALLKAQDPARDWRALRNLILAGGDPTPAMTGRTISGRRLNAFNAANCSNRPLFSAVEVPALFTAGTPVTVSALSINCAAAVGPVTVTPSTGAAFTLRDDGVAPDLAAGDGLFTATWTPAAGVIYIDLASAAGSERVGLPDLGVSAVSGPATGSRGQAIAVSATVTNTGAGPSAATTLGFYLSSDATITTADALIGTVSLPALAVGAQQVLNTSFPVPVSVANGSYRIGAIADPANTVAEASETNNTRAATTTLTVSTIPIDLTVSALSAPSTGNTGNPVSISATVRNAGTAAAGASTLMLVLSTDTTITTGDIFLGTIAVPALAGGASAVLTASPRIPPNLVPGTYSVGAIADANGVVIETNEANNTRAALNRITTSTLPVDLVITAVAGPASASDGQTVTLSGTVKNQGTATAAAQTVSFHLSADATITAGDLVLASVPVGALAAGASQPLSVTVTMPGTVATGTYYVGAFADSANLVVETNENNNGLAGNTLAFTNNRVDLPDLVVTTAAGPASAGTGQTVSFTGTVKNQGGAAMVNRSWVRAYLSTDATITAADTPVGDTWIDFLGVDQSATVTINAPIPAQLAAGTYYVGLIADANGEILEINESNNTRAGNPIAVSVGPDLVMTAVDGPLAAGTGQTITLTGTLKNQGIGAVNSRIWIGFYLSTDGTITATDRQIGSTWVDAIAPGQSVPLTVSTFVPTDLAPGTYTVGVIADTAGNVAESNETNNALAGNSVVVNIGADLAMTAVAGPASAATGQPVTLTATMRNQGSGAMNTRAWVGWYLSTDPTITTADRQIASSWVDYLDAGQSAPLSVQTTLPTDLPPGTYYLGAIADPAGAVAESIETNNTIAGGTMSVSIGGDLVVTAVAGPATATTGATVTLTATLTNQGVGVINTRSWIGWYLSPDPSVTTADRQIASSWVDYLDIGQAVARSASVPIPTDLAPGTYYLGAIADPGNAIPEANEGNNVLASGTITLTVGADLTVTAVSGPATAATGQAVTLGATVANVGTGVVNNRAWIGWYLSTDPSVTTADRQIASSWVDFLSVGQSVPLTAATTIPTDLAPGTYYLGAIADPGSAIAEANEGNNALASGTITLTIGADLVATAVAAPASAARGQSVTLTGTLANIGTGVANNRIWVGFYLSTDGTITGADRQIGSTWVDYLAIGQSVPLSVIATIPADLPPGTYTIGLIVDTGNGVPESNEGNNTLAGGTVVVGP